MKNFDALKQQLVTIPPKNIATICTYLLLTVFCYQAAILTWKFFPQPAETQQYWQPVLSTRPDDTAQLELSGIRALNLFGKTQVEQAKAPVQTVDAPKTRLRLTLTGVVASSDPERALAIIESGGSQDTYAVGDTIEKTKAELQQVLPDRVLLKYQGNTETLMLDGETFSRSGTPIPSSRGSKQANLTDLRKDLLANPAKITDYVRISPVRKNNKLVGYRVNPGRERTLFKEIGLEPNDLAVSLNGYDLTDTQQAMAIARQLAELTEMSLTVERNGQLHDVYLSLPEQ